METRSVVNGSLLPQFNGKAISIVGTVAKTDNTGLSFELRTTDNVAVQCNMRRPLDDLLEGHVEVHGTAQGKTVFCDEVIQFPHGTNIELDMEGYNKTCIFLNTINDIWRCG